LYQNFKRKPISILWYNLKIKNIFKLLNKSLNMLIQNVESLHQLILFTE